MADLKSLTVTALRELARKHIGPGYSRLKTKSELVRALAEVLPASLNRALAPEADDGAPRTTRAEKKKSKQPRAVSKATEPAASKRGLSTVRALKAKFTGTGKSKAGVAVTDPKKSTGTSSVTTPERPHPSAQVEDRPPLSPAVAEPIAAEAPLAAEPTGKAAPLEAPSPKAIPPRDVEEETVEALEAEEREAEAIDEEAAEVLAKEAALTGTAEPAKEEWVEPPAAKEAKYWDSQLGELPDSYGEDAVVLLPKDPYTVMAFWDFSQDTRARAFADLHWPHAKMRIYDEERGLVREIDFALEARRWYVYNLEPGRRYRVELVATGAGGESRRIGPPSNAVGVPPKGPSPIIDDRFIRIPFDTGPRRLAEGFGELREFASWAQARAQEPAEGVPPETDSQRDELYKLSGGLVVGSSEQMPNWAAGAEQRGGASAGGRYSGQWPWSGILPRRSERPGT